jgi:glycosyltransferase involved in cell wall biosynthesis
MMLNVASINSRLPMQRPLADPVLPPAAQRRVLYVDHTAKLGGAELALIHMVANIGPGYQPVVVLFSEGPLVDRLLAMGIETHVLPLDRSVTEARKDSLGLASLLRIFGLVRIFLFILELRRFIRRHEIAIVHTNSLKADLIGGIAARFARVPVIWHLRDRISDDYLPPIVARVVRRLARIIPHQVIANSLATLKTLRLKSYRDAHVLPNAPALARRFHVIHDGINLRELPPAPVDEPRRILTVGLVGRITPWKGQHIFIEAAAIVRREFANVRFQIVGGALFNETEYEDEIRKLLALRELEDVVEMTGQVPDAKRLIAKMDLVVHASITGEPFGQVIIEGMEAGKPIVATNGGGVPEIVLHGVTGLLVPMGDVTAMAQAILRFLGDREFREKTGRLGRQRILSHFTIDQMVRKIHRVYEKAFDGAEESRPMTRFDDLAGAPLENG